MRPRVAGHGGGRQIVCDWVGAADSTRPNEKHVTVTVLDRLRSTGATDDEALRAASVIAAFLPVGRNVRVTDEVLDAARAGDALLISMLLAEEVDPEPDEIAALEAADRENQLDSRLYTADEIRKELNL
jgi:hypothetical protein